MYSDKLPSGNWSPILMVMDDSFICINIKKAAPEVRLFPE
jgi:hypothetical protein